MGLGLFRSRIQNSGFVSASKKGFLATMVVWQKSELSSSVTRRIMSMHLSVVLRPWNLLARVILYVAGTTLRWNTTPVRWAYHLRSSRDGCFSPRVS